METKGPLLPYVPRMLAQRAPAEPQHWSLPGTLVCADISGFTALTERLTSGGRVGSEQLVTTLNDVYTTLLTATSDRGDVLRFSGDALLIFYDGDDHTSRAVHAAQGMRRALKRMGAVATPKGQVRIEMAVGVHRDTFDFFLTGASHLELLMGGPAASSAVRLQDEALGGQVLLSEAAAKAVPEARLDQQADGSYALAEIDPLPPAEATVSAGDAALDRYIAAPLRDLLRRARAEYEHRTAVVAFLGLRGTDDVATRGGPQALFDHLQHAMTQVQQACDDFNVSVISADLAVDGINVMLAAGTPISTEDDAGRMLHAARRIAERAAPAHVQIGVNRGHVFGGDVGASIRRTYSVMGDVVNVAARLMSKAAPGSVLAHRDVITASRAAFEDGPLQTLTVKGKSEGVPAVVVGPPQAPATGRRSDEVPFVGRRAELEAVGKLLSSAGRAGAAVEIVGEAGIGKSRFVDQWLQTVSGRQVLKAACQPFGTAQPYAVAAALLRQVLDIAPDASPEEAGGALSDAVMRAAPDLARWVPLLAPAFDARVAETDAVEDLAPQFRAARRAEVTAQLLRTVLPSPTVFLIEDTFWIDEASRDLLQHLLLLLDDVPWVILTTRRTGSTWPADAGRVATIRLQPLAADDGVELGRVAADTTPVSGSRLRSLLGKSGGNPLFLLELIRSEQEGGSGADLPDSLEAIAQVRLDRLPPDDRTAVRHLSVLGTRFPRRLADEYAEAAGVSVFQLDRLDDLLSLDEPHTVRFRHELFRTAGYEALPFSRRRVLHGLAGQAWEHHLGERVADESGLLSLHFHRAGDWRRTWRYGLEAAEQARASAANADAADAYRRALDAAAHLDDVDAGVVARAAESMGDVCELAGLFDQADDAYGRARRAVADSTAHSRVLWKQGILRERKGDYAGALRWYRRCMSAAEQADPSERAHLVATAQLAYAGVRYRQGKLRDCARWAHEAEKLAESAGDRVSLAHAYYLLDAAYTDLGEQPPAEYRQLALPVFEEVGDFVRQGNVLNNLGIDAYYEGQWDAALEYYARSRDARERAGDLVGTAMSINNMGEVLSDQGHFDAAADLFREALHDWQWARYAVGEAVALSNLGRASGRAGRHEEGLAQLRQAEALFEQIGSDVFVLDVRSRVAELLVAMGRSVEGWDLAGETRRALTKLGAERMYLPLLERTRGVALASTGSFQRAEAHLRESLHAARAAGLAYEEALTLLELASLPQSDDGAARIEAERILDGLGCKVSGSTHNEGRHGGGRRSGIGRQ